MTTFGERIARLRKKQGLSQLELAKRLNISKSTLGMYEINKREPNFDTLIQIAEYFEVTLDYLIAGKVNTIFPENHTPGMCICYIVRF